MAIANGTTLFYPSATDQDQAWGIDVRKLALSVPALDSTTIAAHGSTANTTQIAIDPYTTRSTTGDNRDTFGWAMDEASADGVGSTATYKRRIPAGNWTFTRRLTLPTAGAVTGTLTGSFSARVYRVGPSPTFTRSQLFTTAFSTTVQSTASGAVTGTCSVTHAASEIVLEAGETIHIGILSQVTQVAGLAGATVAGNATWHTGTQGGVDISVQTPAMRTITEITGTASGSCTAEAITGKVLGMTGSAAGTSDATAVVGTIAATTGSAAGTSEALGVTSSIAAFTGAAAGTSEALGVTGLIAGMVGTCDIGAGGSGPTTVYRRYQLYDYEAP